MFNTQDATASGKYSELITTVAFRSGNQPKPRLRWRVLVTPSGERCWGVWAGGVFRLLSQQPDEMKLWEIARKTA